MYVPLHSGLSDHGVVFIVQLQPPDAQPSHHSLSAFSQPLLSHFLGAGLTMCYNQVESRRLDEGGIETGPCRPRTAKLVSRENRRW